jgi:hypothetical protein
VKDVVQTGVFIDSFYGHDIARFRDRTDYRSVASWIGTNLTYLQLAHIEARRAKPQTVLCVAESIGKPTYVVVGLSKNVISEPLR